MASIQDLPPEILGYIFEHLFSLNITITPPISSNQPEFHWKFDELSDPSLFPCAVAHVSEYWREVAAKYELFWGRFSFDLASPHLLVNAVSWVKGGDFSTLIFDSRRSLSDATIPSPAEEERRVQFIMKYLSPHLHHCTSLGFEVFHASSIPNIPEMLPQLSKETKSLILDPRFSTPTDHAAISRWRVFEPSQIPLFERLQTLSLDVAAFLKLRTTYPTWWSTSYYFALITLTLSNYEFGYWKNENAYTTEDFFDSLRSLAPQLTSLRLRNISIRPPFNRSHYPSSPADLDGNIPSIYFQNLSTEFMFAFLSYFATSADYAQIEASGIPTNIARLHVAYDLELVNLAPDVDIIQLLQDCLDGRSLKVDRCPSFNDDLLRLLSERYLTVFPPNFVSLHLVSCCSVSPEALEALLRACNIEELRISDMPQFGTADDVMLFHGLVGRLFAYD